jgi:D-beta-D-heptose 7-phosphate kinase/D-beta-D-heptose 1-phosphate adenosyltransferase
MKTVVVNGTFDILHAGHIRLLNTARNMGDHLLVCIDSDRRVSALKGTTRPINTQSDRKELLLNIKAVDQVEVFDTDEELIAILKKYNPDIMVKGSDWKDKPIVGSQNVKHIEYFERLEEYATTKTIQNIIDRR